MTTDTTSEKILFDIGNNELLNDEKLLADQIKQLEAITDHRLDPFHPFVVRIDGVSFRNYTRGFDKPFDQRMTRAFIRTSADLLQRFSPLTIYYESDEISLVFDACPILESTEKHPREHMYSGRVQKLVSVLASYTAAKFNKYINEEDWSNIENNHVRERITSHSAYFDGRAFSVPNQFAAMASIYWRHRYDTLKNATMTYALSYYPQNAILGKSPHELRDLMRAEKNWDMLDEAPKNIIYGTFLKKEFYDLETIDRKTQEPVVAKRSRIRIGSFNMSKLLPTNEEKIQFIMSKYWNDGNITMSDIEVPDWWLKYYRQKETGTTD
jgi:tRNA(His) 5'-end guanylyltransferase